MPLYDWRSDRQYRAANPGNTAAKTAPSFGKALAQIINNYGKGNMKQKTSLATGIDIAKDKADYDAACKRLLSEKIILAWIMKSCLDEFRDFDVNMIADKCIEGTPFMSEVPVSPDETVPAIQGLANEQSSLTEGNITFDIYFNAIAPGREEPVQIIINVEAQGDFYPGYPLMKRAVFYCGRMLSAQKGTVFAESHYEKLRKVYSIWICAAPPKRLENTVARYRLAEESLIGRVKQNRANYDLLTIIMICLGDSSKCSCNGILRLLGVLLSKEVTPAEKKHILQEEFTIPMTRIIEREVSCMSNLGDGIEARGIRKGIKQGLAQGIEQGLAQGEANGLLIALKNLMASMNWTVEEAMNALCIPEADRAAFISRLSQ